MNSRTRTARIAAAAEATNGMAKWESYAKLPTMNAVNRETELQKESPRSVSSKRSPSPDASRLSWSSAVYAPESKVSAIPNLSENEDRECRMRDEQDEADHRKPKPDEDRGLSARAVGDEARRNLKKHRRDGLRAQEECDMERRIHDILHVDDQNWDMEESRLQY